MADPQSVIIGLTGGIGTGKSRVADLLESLGAAIVDSDKIVREIQKAGSEALGEIAETFGAEFLLPSGELDRPRLGKLIFDDPDARLKLNKIIHPRVTRALRERMEAHVAAGVPVVVVDIPLLLEGRKAGTGAGAVLPFDVVAVIYADEATQVERVVARDGLPREDALARVRSQMSIEEKRELADLVIDNTGTWEQTEATVREHFARWLERATST